MKTRATEEMKTTAPQKTFQAWLWVSERWWNPCDDVHRLNPAISIS
jgi:hypothetical protein